ncbi:MAG: hypothetical protein JSS35_12660, partial [Proteobacteria bacterium]|nr:hypothetical protein [Pseudomonadota bacterium]
SIATEESERVAADTAEALLRTGLASTVAANQASAETQFETLSDAQSATSTELHLLGAANGTGTAFLLDLSKVQTAPGVSFGSRLAGIDTSLSTSAAAISAESSARASGDSANASSISSLSATVGGFSASISAQSSAISDLQGRTQAYMQIVAAAGSDPAYLKLLATGFGSAIMLAAQSIGLFNVSGGTVLKVLEIISGETHVSRVILIDGGGKRLALGPAFGAAGNLVMWFGVDSIGVASMTIGNSAFAMATDGGVYHGGSALGGSGLTVSLSATGFLANGNGLGAGTFTTNAITATIGGGVAPYAIVWSGSCSDGSGSAKLNGQGTVTASFTKFQANNQDTEGQAGIFIKDSSTPP